MNTKPKFTPGPWRIERTSSGIAIMHGEKIVAIVNDFDDAETTANQNAISSLPDLYDALQGLMAIHIRLDLKPSPERDTADNILLLVEAESKALQAVAKAQGRTPLLESMAKARGVKL